MHGMSASELYIVLGFVVALERLGLSDGGTRWKMAVEMYRKLKDKR